MSIDTLFYTGVATACVGILMVVIAVGMEVMK